MSITLKLPVAENCEEIVKKWKAQTEAEYPGHGYAGACGALQAHYRRLQERAEKQVKLLRLLHKGFGLCRDCATDEDCENCRVCAICTRAIVSTPYALKE